MPTASGAFSFQEKINYHGESYKFSGNRPEYLFSANASCATYSSNTVQPAALQTLIIIKA